MKIRSHSESHIVELDDGSRWQIFPGDLDLTLNWQSETDLRVAPSDSMFVQIPSPGSSPGAPVFTLTQCGDRPV